MNKFILAISPDIFELEDGHIFLSSAFLRWSKLIRGKIKLYGVYYGKTVRYVEIHTFDETVWIEARLRWKEYGPAAKYPFPAVPHDHHRELRLTMDWDLSW